jgi:transcriptional regulator with XRE-family HTH domain
MPGGPNERLRSALLTSGCTERALAEEAGVDLKTVERWVLTGRTPHRRTAWRVARRLGVAAAWLWPGLERSRAAAATPPELVAYYPHRAEVPRGLWMDVLAAARREIGLFADAALFLPEENPEAVGLLRRKAAQGVRVRLLLGDPDTPEMALRGEEERLDIPARVRMALAYYRPLAGVPGLAFHLHRTALYNSIFISDDELLVNTHVYGEYGYMAPVLHLRRVEGADLVAMYARSFERVWGASYPVGPEELDRRLGARPAPASP